MTDGRVSAVIDGLVLHLVGHGVKPEDFRQGGEDERPVVISARPSSLSPLEERMARPILHPRTSERLPLWRFLEVQARELALSARRHARLPPLSFVNKMEKAFYLISYDLPTTSAVTRLPNPEGYGTRVSTASLSFG